MSNKFTLAIIAFLVFHFIGFAVYITTVDEFYCQGSVQQKLDNECYEWKGAAGIWEIVLFQEFIIRPVVKGVKENDH